MHNRVCLLLTKIFMHCKQMYSELVEFPSGGQAVCGLPSPSRAEARHGLSGQAEGVCRGGGS
eukprot:scaffold505233_cov42-Prasinocladus_malaysianus.AAC.1